MASLTAKQEAFAQHFAVHRDNRAAYRHAYDPPATTPEKQIHEVACRVRQNYNVAARILELERMALAESGLMVKLTDMLQREIAIATADPAELMSTQVGNCRFCNGDGHRYQWRDDEFAEAMRLAESMPGTPMPDIQGGVGWRPFHTPQPDCPECGGAGVTHTSFKATSELSSTGRLLFRGVKQTRGGGFEILTADQSKAAENVIRMLGGFKDSLNLTGALGVVAKTAELAPDDPHAATKAYDDFLKAGI
jgi:phage terminase small subunit